MNFVTTAGEFYAVRLECSHESLQGLPGEVKQKQDFMKQLLVLTIAGSLFFISCNNSSTQSTTADSTGTTVSPNTGAPATPPATTSPDSTKAAGPIKDSLR
jgi:hypothetical protein